MRTLLLLSALTLALPLTACGDDTGGGGSGGGGGGDASTTDATTGTTTATTGTTTATTATGSSGDVAEVTCPATPDAELTNEGLTGFAPSTLTIPAGGIVHFAPTGPHNVTLDDNSFATTTSADVCIQFNTAGSYPFHCSVHVAMQGTITVE